MSFSWSAWHMIIWPQDDAAASSLVYISHSHHVLACPLEIQRCRGGDGEDVREAGLFWRTRSTRPRHLVACKCYSPGQIRRFVIQSFARSISRFRKRSQPHSVAPSCVPSERKRERMAKASKQALSVCVCLLFFSPLLITLNYYV